MTGRTEDYERTMAFADIALGQMKALRQVATPRNYEIWYAYASGYHPALNQQVNATIKAKGTISEADLAQIYENHLSPTRLTERIDLVGSQVKGEIDQVMAMIDAAVGSATNYTESLTDPLTQLANRKFFDVTLEKTIAEAFSRNEALSLMLTDIDHFKAFNDNFGHLTGDQVLRLVAMAVKHNVKGKDTAARYGGEEFAVVLPNTALRAAVTVAEHIRRAVMAKELMKRSTGEQLGRITISIGVAALRKGDSGQSLIERADICLYAAKRHGRNRVMCEADPEVTAESTAAEVA